MVRLRVVFYSAVTVLFFALLMFARLTAQGSKARTPNDGAARSPVLVELFTSEGCSDCPPADALLERLDRSEPIGGAELIVMSEHVDYWNNMGWKDPYSSIEYTERQNTYAGFFKLESVYTPQMVVDGRFQIVGSDGRQALDAIQAAGKADKTPVMLTSAHRESDQVIVVQITTGRLPSSGAAPIANIWLAVADDQEQSHVVGGENGGKTLKHVAVVRTLMKIGTVDRVHEFSQQVRINNTRASGGIRLICFVQETQRGTILGAGRVRLAG